MRKTSSLRIAYWAVWIVSALYVVLSETDGLPTGYITGRYATYYLGLAAIVATLGGVYLALKLFRLATVRKRLANAPQAGAELRKWMGIRTGLMAFVIWGDLFVYYATLSSQGGFCALIALLGFVFCRPLSVPSQPSQSPKA